MGDRGKAVKGFPCRQVGIPTRAGDFHFQHGFYEMWVTKALNGDREQAQLFLAFGRGREEAGIPARSPIASRSHRALYGAVPGACAGGRLVGGAYAPCRPYRRPHVRLVSLFPRLISDMNSFIYIIMNTRFEIDLALL